MDTKELRRGNLVMDTYDNIICIDALGANYVWSEMKIIHEDRISSTSIPKLNYDIKPIPLTEEWLVSKFGAMEHYRTPFFNIVMPRNIGFISINPNNKIIWLKHHNSDSSLNPGTIEFVHQLQNLYFALTQTELTIK